MSSRSSLSLSELALDARAGLPEELQIILKEHPREAWPMDPEFHGLAAFWLERHMLFRKLTVLLRSDAESLIDRDMDPEEYRRRLSHLGGMLVNQLHGHHMIEDEQFFPQLESLEMKLQRGFEMLDQDHHAMDGLLKRLTDGANAALRPGQRSVDLRETVVSFKDELKHFNHLLERHLTDEEDLVLPIILKHHVG